MTVRRASYVVASVLCVAPLAAQQIPQIPDSSGWGVHVLTLARAPDGAIWVGTYGQAGKLTWVEFKR